MKLATEQDAGSAPVVALEMEVELPETFDGSATTSPTRAATSAAETDLDDLEDHPAERTTATAPPTVDLKPTNARERELLARATEERNKRKRLADRARKLEEENEQLRSRQPAVTQTPSLLVPETEEQRAKRKKALVDAAHEKDTIAEVVELVFDDVNAYVEGRLKAVDTSFIRTIDSTKTVVDEKIFRSKHDDYDALLTKAGVFDALKVLPNGQFQNPAVARRVYTSPNAAAEAYAVAQELLALEEEKADGRPSTGRDRETTAEPRTSVAPDAVAEAERRGRRDAFEEVAQTDNRRGGLRHLPGSSGPRRAVITKEYLDGLMEQNYPAYEALMAKNPALERWHMS